MWNKIILSLLIFGLAIANFVFVIDTFAATESTNYTIFADAFTAGGSELSSSTLYGLQDSIGESIISSTTNATTTSSGTTPNYGIKSGFRELYPDQSLTFSITGATVNLGTLNTSNTGNAANTITIATIATNGFTITATGNKVSLTNADGDTITAMGATAVASVQDTEQFGINLVDNATPNVGSDPSGTAPLGSAANQYNTADLFAWASGATIATSTSAIGSTTFTISYIGNVGNDTEDGTYAMTITYAATANF